jgi:septation ring formation regulator EzrA
MDFDIPSWSELRARHAAEMTRIDSEIESSRRETNRLRKQNALKRQQFERFDRAFVALRRKLRAQTWQPLPPLVPTSPSSSEKN